MGERLGARTLRAPSKRPRALLLPWTATRTCPRRGALGAPARGRHADGAAGRQALPASEARAGARRGGLDGERPPRAAHRAGPGARRTRRPPPLAPPRRRARSREADRGARRSRTGEQQVRSLRARNRIAAERAARSCYDHLAGRLGVARHRRALRRRRARARARSPCATRRRSSGSASTWRARRAGAGRSRAPAWTGASAARTSPARSAPRCWAAARPQAGSRAGRGGRALRVTPAGADGLRAVLGIDAAHLAATHGGRAV